PAHFSSLRGGQSMCTVNRSEPSDITLSPARRRLLEIIRGLQFGRVEDLHVQAGEPVFNPAPRFVRSQKFGVAREALGEQKLGTPRLKEQMTDLLALLDQVGTGVIRSIIVTDGLPLVAEVQEAMA